MLLGMTVVLGVMGLRPAWADPPRLAQRQLTAASYNLYLGADLTPFLLERAGLRPRDFEPVAAALRGGGVGAAARLVTPAILDLGIAGGPEEVLARCRWLHEQGATHVSFGPPLGPDPLAAVDTLGRQVLPRLDA